MGAGLPTVSVLALLLPALWAGCVEKVPVQIADIHGMAVDPNDSGRLFVATHHGLFRAQADTDWTAVTKEPFDMMGFTMHPSDSSIMYASGHPRMGGLLGFAKSTDAGESWEVIALEGQVDFHAMTLSLVDPVRVWGYWRGAIQRSDDAGLQWAIVSASPPPEISGLAPDAASRETLYAAGPGGIHRSNDGGATFEALYSQSGAATVIATTKSQPDFTVAYFASGGLKQSTDAGRTWTSINLTFAGDDAAAAIAIDPTDARTINVGSYRALIRKTVDGGTTWADIGP